MERWDPVAVRVAVWFTVVSALWILLSDTVVASIVSDPARLTEIQTYKGWAYVVLAGGLVYAVTAREVRRRARAEGALARTEQLQDLLVDQVRDHAILAADNAGRVATWNAGALATFGYTESQAVGRDVRQFLAQQDDAWEWPTEAGTVPIERTAWCKRADGSVVWARLTVTELHGTAGERIGYSCVFQDLTESRRQDRSRAELLIREHAVRMEAEMSASWSRFLAESTEALSATLDPSEVVETAARLAVGEMADWAAMYVLQPDARLVRKVVRHRDPLKEDVAHRLEADHVSVSAAHPVREALRTGRPKLINALTPERLRQYATDATQLDLMERLGTRSVIVAPLVARGHAIGGILIAYGDSGRVYADQDLTHAMDLVGRAALAFDNARLFQEAESARALAESAGMRVREQLRRLDALRSIDLAIAGSPEIRLTLGVILDHVVGQVGVDAAAVLSFDRATGYIVHVANRGFRTDEITKTRLLPGEGTTGRAVRERRLIETPEPTNSSTFVRADLIRKESFSYHAAVPLTAKGAIRGVLEVFHRAAVELGDDRIEFLQALAAHAAIAIDSASMFSDLQRSNAELARAYDLTLEGWARALELRDMETQGHSERVTVQTLRLARRMGIGDAELVHVRRGALLHDIGKMAVPDSILLKPGPLDEVEWSIMRQHPVHAYELLSPIPFLRPALDIPLFHHEWFNGKGYPYGLARDSIPLTARIFAVVDVWDALSRRRPYRDAWPADRVHRHLSEQAGTHFDEHVVNEFLDLQTGASLV
jgi:PAS domain S-box-containing protein